MSREIMMKLMELGVTARKKDARTFVDPSSDPVLRTVGVAGVGGWLEELGKHGLVGKVRPSFGSDGPTLEYQITDKAVAMWGNQPDLLKTISDLLPADPQMYDVFISYGHADAHVASELRDVLEAEGLTCFMAEKDVQIGAEWQGQIRDALCGAQTVLVLLTPRSHQRPWVLLETGAAWALNKPLIPALIQLSPNELVEPLKRYQARVLETAAQIRDLAKELKMILQKSQGP